MQKYTAAITVPAKMIRKFSAEVNTRTAAGTARHQDADGRDTEPVEWN